MSYDYALSIRYAADDGIGIIMSYNKSLKELFGIPCQIHARDKPPAIYEKSTEEEKQKKKKKHGKS